MSEITPAYRPFESRCNPSSPDKALTTAYPLRSSAARRKAITDGSSSISRIGPPVHNAFCAFIVLLLSCPRPPARLPSPLESAPQKCFPLHLHCSSIEGGAGSTFVWRIPVATGAAVESAPQTSYPLHLR